MSIVACGRLRRVVCVLALAGVASPALALPQSHKVAQGSVSVSSRGTVMTVTQKATRQNRAVVNWQSFNVASDESVRFVQPNAGSLLVNRVVGPCSAICYS